MKYIYPVLLFFLFSTSAFAQNRGAFLGLLNNAHASFVVHIEVNHPDRVYTKDDLLQTTIESSEEGYLYLFCRNAEGNVAMLFPNRFKKNNVIRKNESITVPAEGSISQIRIDAPFGNELIKAVVSKKPLAFFGDLDLTGINTLVIGEEDGRELALSLKALEPLDWAEGQVFIRTVDPDNPNPTIKRTIKRPFLGRIIFRLKNGRNYRIEQN